MRSKKKSAIIYCENEFGKVDGKTAAGLVRHSEMYQIVGVVDSSLAGKDAGQELGGAKNGIPIFASLQEACGKLPVIPSALIYGKAPLEPKLCNKERGVIVEAIHKGMDIINGLHEFLSDDPEMALAAKVAKVHIRDIRKPPELAGLHLFTGEIAAKTVPVVAVLGTDCASGKRTTAVILQQELRDLGVNVFLVATGQTGLMQGARYGRSIDALPSQFVIGELEHAVLQIIEHENPDLILIEGQSAVSHPAFMSSVGILKGCMPDAVILQHAPARKVRCDFPQLPMPNVRSEIKLIESISNAKVIALALSHEGLEPGEMKKEVKDHELRFQLPTTDVLTNGSQKLVQSLVAYFPALAKKVTNLEFTPISA